MAKTKDRNFLACIVALGLVPFSVACGDDESAGGTEGGTSGQTDGASMSGTTSATTSSSTTVATGTEGSETGAPTSDPTGPGGSTGSGSSGSDSSATEPDGTTSQTSTSGSDSGSESGAESGSSSTGSTLEICEAPGELIPCDADTTDPFQAMGLGCPFGANEAIPIFNELFSSVDSTSWRIARQFGTYIEPGVGLPLWRAREGEQFLMITTGTLTAPDANGVITMPSGAHDGGYASQNLDNRQLPAPMSALRGSNSGAGGTPFLNCDFVHDCSDSLLAEWNQGGSAANDLLWFQFDVAVPGGTHGFSFDFAYFSAEFPEWVGFEYNDIFAVWSTSETYTGNLCFVNDRPCTVTALWPAQHQANDPALAGTGFEPSGGTGWFQAKGSVSPGELLQLTFAIFDMGDTAFDTAVILDNFQWDCEGCTPSEVDPCIGIDPV